MTRLIDRWMPEFGAHEVHHIEVAAPMEATFRALQNADLARSGIVRGLMSVRAIPAVIRTRSGLEEFRRRARHPVTLDALASSGFTLLEEMPPRELVLGLEGRFWTPGGGVTRQDVHKYLEPIPHGVVRAIWDFSIAEPKRESCRLTTETRIHWSDEVAGRSFMRYWRFVRPWSGLIRRYMLKSVKLTAESPAGA